MAPSTEDSSTTERLPPGELETRAGWLLAAVALALFPIIAAPVVFGLMGATFGWLASTKRHPQGRRVMLAGLASAGIGLVLGLLWAVLVKAG